MRELAAGCCVVVGVSERVVCRSLAAEEGGV
jgi:hypothetical protein